MKLELPRALRDLAFRRFWFGETISLFGDQITLIALPLAAVLVLDASPAQMGYLGAASLAPNLFFALHAGAIVDRRGKRRQTMIAADLGRALLLATIPVAYAFDVLTIAQLYAVAFATGSLTVFFTVAYHAYLPTLVERELLDDSGAPELLGFPDEQAFAKAIRAGELDARGAEVTAVLHELVRHRLAVAHPGYERE